MPTYGAQAGLAKMSAQPMLNEQESTESEADCSSLSWTWLTKFAHSGSFSKMCRASYLPIKAPLLKRLSTGLKRAGIWGVGRRATLSTSACPKTENELSLSQVLEPTVPIRSLLTAANCSGIIRREVKNNREVPPPLLAALEETIRLWCNVGEASGTPEDRVFAPRYVPKPDDIREAIQTDRYFVARNLTWREWERLMGFPDDWTVVEGD